jgi:hypothetical protein
MHVLPSLFPQHMQNQGKVKLMAQGQMVWSVDPHLVLSPIE